MHDISSVQNNKLASKLGSILLKKKLTISTAESCTGGLVSAAITEIPGSSQWFLQGWVTYSNKSKISELNVPLELIEQYGAVSKEVVTAMAQGALNKSGANISIATSGVAGPDGGTADKPVGTVWIAIAVENKLTASILLRLDGTRANIRELTVQSVLQELLELIK